MPSPEHSVPTSAEQPELHLVAHTHWDREWYHTAARFQQRLVALVDVLLDGEATPASPFLLDGQAIVLEDYLSVRPERAALLRERLNDGSLEAGPWYVLADNLIPSGEAIVRNLQAGRRLLKRLHAAAAPSVAYCPDTFGHPAAMPMIAGGFGLNVAIAWRGIGGPGHPLSDTMWWSSQDESRVLLWHLPRDGYEFGSALPGTVESARERWAAIETDLIDRNETGVMLLPNGADHHALQTQLDSAVVVLHDAATNAGSSVRIMRSTLQQFADALIRRASVANLPTVDGELRNSYGYTWTLQGTLGTRAADKRRNAQLERMLLHDVEPWCALAVLHKQHAPPSMDGRVMPDQLVPLLAHAWQTLLQTHPHDTLCGCSIDDVARSMRERQRSVHAQAAGLRHDALMLAIGHDVVAARMFAVRCDDFTPVMVRNRAARPRAGVAELRLIETLGDVPVGPSSAELLQPDANRQLADIAFGTNTVQRLRSRVAHLRRESPQHYPDDDLVRYHDIVAWVPAVPALGVSLLLGDEPVPALPAPAMVHEEGTELAIDNALLRVTAGKDGVSITTKGVTLPNVLGFETTADLGDSYTPSLRGESALFDISTLRVGEAGPLRASLIIDWRLGHDSGESNDSSSKKLITVRTELILDAGARHLRIDMSGVNRKRDHRLRMFLHCAMPDTVIHADAAFGPVKREPIIVEEELQRRERVPATMPMHRWLSVSNASHGLALLSDGLAEAEADEHGIALTILRAIGELSRPDLPERPGHAGWPAPIPDAQSQGKFRARVGLLVHDAWGAATLDDIEDATEALLLPLTGETIRDYNGNQRSVRGIELRGAGLRVQSFTPAQDGNGVVLHVVNGWNEQVHGLLLFPDYPLMFATSRLDETLLTDWCDAGNERQLSVPPHSVLTIRLRRQEEHRPPGYTPQQ